MKAVTLNWGPIFCECDECICQTEVSFREQGNPDWYTPDTLTNPTQNTIYEILINEGTYYQVRLTHRGPLCQEKESFISLYYPVDACCPSGYTMNEENTLCYQVEDIAATPPSGPVDTLAAATNVKYTVFGTWIYSAGYNIDGTGTSAQITLTNAFWKNGTGLGPDGTTVDGPLNRTGVWASILQDNQDIGFGVCIDVPNTKTYYIGIGCDNYSIIRVDGVTIIDQDDVALAAQYSGDIAAPFKVWHIYPVQLTAGPHVLELVGHNVTGAAGLGCEIYDATAAQLIAATSYVDLGSRLIFSSKDYIGEDVQIGTVDAGYTCPDGYALATCESPVVCRRITTAAKVDCIT